MNPRYPVYVLTYDRWQDERRKTIKALERMKVPYYAIVEPEEVELYAKKIDKKKILEMPQEYHYNFDPCCEHEKMARKGSGPPRNFAWDHSISMGYERHWIIDDNIREFQRINNNHYYQVSDGTIFRVMEDFVDRYTNIALAGPNYTFFVPQKEKRNPITINTRIYSCLLIKTTSL